MQKLLEKIEASAAARLPLPPGRQPTQQLGRYKNLLRTFPRFNLVNAAEFFGGSAALYSFDA